MQSPQANGGAISVSDFGNFLPFPVFGCKSYFFALFVNSRTFGRGQMFPGQRRGIGISDGLGYSAREEAGGGDGRNYPVRLADAMPHSNVKINIDMTVIDLILCVFKFILLIFDYSVNDIKKAYSIAVSLNASNLPEAPP